MAILADSPDDVPRIAKTIDDMFANSSPQTKTESEQQFALSFVSFLGNIKLFLLSICAAVTFTILLVSGNTMAMSVRERINEVGVLKTLGFTDNTILGVLIGEAITIALIGGTLGLILASILTVGVGKAGAAFVGQLHNLSHDAGHRVYRFVHRGADRFHQFFPAGLEGCQDDHTGLAALQRIERNSWRFLFPITSATWLFARRQR